MLNFCVMHIDSAIAIQGRGGLTTEVPTAIPSILIPMPKPSVPKPQMKQKEQTSSNVEGLVAEYTAPSTCGVTTETMVTTFSRAWRSWNTNHT